MDNATAEYSFVASFFFVEPLAPPSAEELEIGQHSITPEPRDRKEVDDNDSAADSEARTPVPNPGIVELHGLGRLATMDKAERTELNSIWKKIFDPSLEYTKAGHGRHIRKSEFDSHFFISSDILGFRHRTSTASDSPPDHGPADGSCHCRGSETPMFTSGDLFLHHAPAALARIPKSRFGAL